MKLLRYLLAAANAAVFLLFLRLCASAGSGQPTHVLLGLAALAAINAAAVLPKRPS